MIVTSTCLTFRANHASTNLKKVLSRKTRQVYFIHPFPRRLKLGKSLETCCVNLFVLKNYLKIVHAIFQQREISYLKKAIV